MAAEASTITNNVTAFLKVNAVLLCVVNVVLTFVGTFLNSVVIISLLNSQLRRKLCYFMILVLACFDLAVVVVFHPFIIFQIYFCLVSMRFTESMTVSFLEHLFVFSLTALLTMTLERYLALLYPFFHEKFVTKSRLFGIFLLLQLPFAMLYVILLLDRSSYLRGIALALIGIVFLVIFCLNYKIFYTARIVRRRVAITLGNLDQSEQRNTESRKSKVTLGKISTCLLAVVCLFVCYFPGIISYGIEITGKKKQWSEQTWCIIGFWIKTFVTLNSSLNCLIFFYKNSALRRHGQHMLEKCLWSRSH